MRTTDQKNKRKDRGCQSPVATARSAQQPGAELPNGLLFPHLTPVTQYNCMQGCNVNTARDPALQGICAHPKFLKKQVKWVSCIGSVLWRLHCPTKSRAGTAPERHVPSASPSLLAYSTPALPPPNVPPSEANDQGKPAHNWLSLFRLAFYVEQNANKLVQAN